MKEILKTLKNYKWQIIIVLILLFIQAYCNLALPSYTSNIVDIGIAQKGVENIVPEVIRKSEYETLYKLLNKEEKQILSKNYTYIEKNDKKYINEYKILKEEPVYILKKHNNIEELEEILLYPLFTLAGKNKLAEINKETIIELKETYNDNETLLKSMIASYILEEYEEIGLDLKKLEMTYIYKTGGIMIIIAVISLLVTGLTVYLSSKISAFFSRDLRKKLLTKIMNFESEEINEFSTASLITRCTNDVVQIQTLLTVFLRIIIYAPIIGIGAMTKVIGSSMGWVIGVAVFLILIMMTILFIVVVPKFKLFQDLLDKLNLVSREILSGLSVIRAFANERHEEKKFEKANEDLTKNGLFVNRAMAIMNPALTLIMYTISIIIVWVGADKINLGELQVGTMIAFITYTMQIITAFLMVSMVAIMLPRAMVSVKRISEIFNKKINIKDKTKTDDFDSKIKGQIIFENVYFKYPNSDEYILKNINFKAEKGTTTAFIGSTGSGKTTLINLIPRFFDVTSGQIKIDGQNIKNVKIKELRNKIGYVPQKSILFSGTIKTNINFGQKKQSDKKIEEAARISQSLEFINMEKEKFERPISEKGNNVSGGQRQRISIARAIANDPEIYIFDDSFSALDYKTDSMLRKELKKSSKDQTIIMVSSRIASIMNADQIIVLDEGEIVGIGTHEELLKTCKIYKEIKESQLGGEN